jgi:protein inturned
VLKEFRIGSASKGKTNKLKKPLNFNKNNANLFETIFNASLILGPDNKRLVVNEIHEGSVFERDLLVGDVVKSIDGEIVTTENINAVLKRIQTHKSFKIVAQSCYKDEFEMSSQDEIKITKISDVVDNKEKLFHLESESHELIFSLNLIVKNENATEDTDDFITIFSFPPKDNNFLHKLKGSFLTISSIMKTSFGKNPLLTSIKVHDTNFYVTYTVCNDEQQFIFLGFNSHYTKLLDARHHTINLVKFFNYIYPNFAAVTDFQQLSTICEMVKIQLLKQSSEVVNFEQLFSCSTYVALPKEIVLRINDSLSELEAMDYRNWNEDLMELFGKFNVFGSCLFYKTSLICSHFSELDMENVELFIRNSCLKLLYQNCLVREIAAWQRIYPKDYQSFNMDNDSAENKVFLLTAAHGNLMMCVLLEENSYNVNPDVETQSSNYLIYFLEEMDDILDHLKVVGIENLTRIWINSAKRPQCKNFLEKGKDGKQDYVETFGHLKSLKEEDEESENDFDSQIDSQKSSSGFDMNDFSDAIYKDFTDIIPQTLTFGPGENVLYHFTQLDTAEGIIISTVTENNQNSKNDILVDIFRRSCIKIHKMLQNTIKFNLMLSKENTKISHKSTSMMPIKEQALKIAFKSESGEIIDFWIVGRLFGTRELFVCYDAKIPQSMVEIAFRLNLNCIG